MFLIGCLQYFVNIKGGQQYGVYLSYYIFNQFGLLYFFCFINGYNNGYLFNSLVEVGVSVYDINISRYVNFRYNVGFDC